MCHHVRKVLSEGVNFIDVKLMIKRPVCADLGPPHLLSASRSPSKLVGRHGNRRSL